jgi:type IV secretory pathway TraG/TraD family ATPase VirD4
MLSEGALTCTAPRAGQPAAISAEPVFFHGAILPAVSLVTSESADRLLREAIRWESIWLVGRGARARHLRDTGPGHVLVFAPTRSGKGAGVVIPTLLTWPDSALIHDLKGENWAVTAGWRKRMGHACLKFDPSWARRANS